MGKISMPGIVSKLVAPVAGIQAVTLAVGSIVKLRENGTPVNYIVVNQGIPGGSSLYDASCDGTWLLRQTILKSTVWSAGKTNKYSTSAIKQLSMPSFDPEVKSVIKTVKIPFCDGGGNSTVLSGANGYSCQAFLLSGYEIGLTNGPVQNFPLDGSKLSYFSFGEFDSKRIANGNWWTRSPYILGGNTLQAVLANTSGGYGIPEVSNSNGIRPALILPSDVLFDDNMNFMGVP